MRLILICFVSSLSIAASIGLSARKTRGTEDDSSEELETSNMLDSSYFGRLRSELESTDLGRLRTKLDSTDLDRLRSEVESIPAEARGTQACSLIVYTILSFLPFGVGEAIITIVLQPKYIFLNIMATFGFGVLANSKYNQIYYCLYYRYRNVFGDNPLTAAATLSGPVSGSLYFTQSPTRTGENDFLAMLGEMEGLEPNKRYSLSVHESGDVSSNCANIGNEIASLGEGSSFVSDGSGKAVLLMRETRVALSGANNVMGGSILLTPEGGGDLVCTPIFRSVVSI